MADSPAHPVPATVSAPADAAPDAPLDAALTERFAGIDRLYGAGALRRFSRAHVGGIL